MIEFIDPQTGEYYMVKPTKATVQLAWKLGYLPASAEDDEKARKVDEE